jgi:hypothetical protein
MDVAESLGPAELGHDDKAVAQLPGVDVDDEMDIREPYMPQTHWETPYYPLNTPFHTPQLLFPSTPSSSTDSLNSTIPTSEDESCDGE